MGIAARANPFAKDTQVTKPPIIRDAFGRALQEEDLIYLEVGRGTPYRVQSIGPVVDPNAPANLMEITLIAQLRFRCVCNEPNQEFVRIQEAQERTSRQVEATIQDAGAAEDAQ